MWLGVITTIALTSDSELHRDYCEKMVKRFESAEGSSVATHICKSCLLLPGCEDIANRFEKPVAEELESGNTSRAFVAFRWGLRALLACRNGDAKLALEYLQKAEGIPATEMAKAQNLAIRALAQGKLGMRSESSESRALAEKIVEGLERDPVFNSHQDLLIARILLRESAE